MPRARRDGEFLSKRKSSCHLDLSLGWNEEGIPVITKDSAYNRYEKKIDDYNFGSLIRTDCRDEYSQHNSIFGMSS